jgi:hypothetical protein
MQLDFFDVPSPCLGVCTSDEKGNCQGCYRTRDERFNWQTFDVAQKQKVIKLCRQREKRKLAKLNLDSPVDEGLALSEEELPLQPSLLDEKVNAKQQIDNSIIEDDFKDFEL